jgi:hypothetical protein
LERDYVSDINWEFVEGTLEKTELEETASFSLEGKKFTNPTGNEEFVSIDVKSRGIEAQSETHTSVILATACYKYKTEFGGNVCVDTDIFNLRPIKKVCQIKDLTFTAGQGAPVAVTKVETQILPDETSNNIRPQFLIHVENKGNGEVVHKQRYGQVCSKFDRVEGEELYEDFNVVFVNAFLSEKQLDCSLADEGDEGRVKLKDKKAVARCVLSQENAIDSNKDAYISTLRVELDYGYTETISAQTTIEKALKY